MNLNLAVDGGGTKTAFVLYAEDFLPRLSFRVGSMRQNTTPAPLVEQAIRQTIRTLREAGVTGLGRVSGAYETPLAEALQREFCPRETVSVGELAPALAAAGIRADGTVVLCGTGCGIYTRLGGSFLGSGGYGALIGDDGSGFAIGRRAIRAVIAAAEGHGAPTVLTQRLCARMGKDTPLEAVFSLYDTQRTCSPACEIAAFCEEVSRAAQQKDAVACAILQEEGRSVAKQYLRHVHQYALPDLPVTVSGSVWKGSVLFAEAMLCAVRTRLPHFILRAPRTEPIGGVVLYHAQQSGVSQNVLDDIAASYEKPHLPCFGEKPYI